MILGALSDVERKRYWAFAEANFQPTAAERTLAQNAITAMRRDNVLIEAIATSTEKAAVGAPLREPDGDVIGALVLHGPIVKSGATTPPASVAAAIKSLEAAIAAAPAKFASPFADMDPDDIRITLPPKPRRD